MCLYFPLVNGGREVTQSYPVHLCSCRLKSDGAMPIPPAYLKPWRELLWFIFNNYISWNVFHCVHTLSFWIIVRTDSHTLFSCIRWRIALWLQRAHRNYLLSHKEKEVDSFLIYYSIKSLFPIWDRQTICGSLERPACSLLSVQRIVQPFWDWPCRVFCLFAFQFQGWSCSLYTHRFLVNVGNLPP